MCNCDWKWNQNFQRKPFETTETYQYISNLKCSNWKWSSFQTLLLPYLAKYLEATWFKNQETWYYSDELPKFLENGNYEQGGLSHKTCLD